MNSSVSSEYTAAEENCTIETCIDTVRNLNEDTWSQLSKEEKLTVCQTVAEIEMNSLGLTDPITVRLKKMSDDTLASYSNQSRTIFLNEDYFYSSSAKESLNSICHESYHAYEYSLIDLYNASDPSYQQLQIFYYVKKYKEELADYHTGDAQYSSQICESDARTYAEYRVSKYCKAIE